MGERQVPGSDGSVLPPAVPPTAVTRAGEAGGARPAKVRDAALFVPLLGAFLLLPPLIELFAAPVRLGGIPLIVLYIFGIWLLLILATLLLSRRLRRLDPALPVERRAPRPPPGGEGREQG